MVANAEKVETRVKKILVCDDDARNLMILSTALSIRGFKVIEAKDGYEAIKILHEQEIDVVISDCNMPIADGFEVIDFAKLKHIDLIFLTTGFATADVKSRAEANGIRAVFEKPLSIREITQTLEVFIN